MVDIKTLHNLERKTLPLIKEGILLSVLIDKSDLKDVEVMRAIQWLENKKLLSTKEEVSVKYELTSKGAESKEKGLPEKRFLKAIKDKRKQQTELNSELKKQGLSELSPPEMGVSIGLLKKNGFVNVINDKGTFFEITKEGEKANFDQLEKLLSNPIEDKEAIQRGLIQKVTRKDKIITITKELSTLQKDAKNYTSNTVDRLTPEMLKSGKWKDVEFREYDVEVNVPKINVGRKHFVNKSIEYMKRIWLDLGFTEMSGDMVQTIFWDLDTLFVPQDHPARQMQDTFYIKDPKSGKLPDLFKKVKEVHENGGDTGSTGWGGKWSKDEASQNMIRTHTTVLSAQYLEKIKNGEYKMPAKFFSVNKVFRNEALDWKHLFEFNQVEGIVVDPNANLKHLKGYLKEFFGKMGFTDVRMRPAHFPYTEPSVEVDVYNPRKKTWVELGGAGIFRPEVTKTLIGVEVPVLAWGLGMERIIVEYFGFKDLRDLYNNKLNLLREMKEWMK